MDQALDSRLRGNDGLRELLPAWLRFAYVHLAIFFLYFHQSMPNFHKPGAEKNTAGRFEMKVPAVF